jgi:uncharacterized membrane protein
MSFVRRHPPFVVFLLLTLIAGLALSNVLHPARAMLAGFDIGATAGLAMLVRRFFVDDGAKMRLRSAANDIDHWTVLAVGMIIVFIITIAVWVELKTGKQDADRVVGLMLSATSCFHYTMRISGIFRVSRGRTAATATTAGSTFRAIRPSRTIGISAISRSCLP